MRLTPAFPHPVTAAVKDSAGNTLFAFKTADTRPALLISSPELKSSGCGVWTGGSISGAKEYFISDNIIIVGSHLYTGGSYSGGTKLSDLS